MRGIKTTTISILALGLLAGSAVGVAAQDEEGVTVVSGQTVDGPRRCEADIQELPPAGDYSGGVRDSCEGWRVDMDDDRLDGVLYWGQSGDTWAVDTDPPGDVTLGWGDVTLGGPVDPWVGTHLGLEGTPFSTGYSTVQLTGTGAYAGLSAVLRVGPDGIEGIIFPGSLPPDR